MILESAPWKDDLLRIAERLKNRYNQKRWSQRSYFLLEKEIFLGFFSVRKLLESDKVATSLTKKNVCLAVYPAGSKAITLLNQDRFAELYDLYANKTKDLTYYDVANQFIHSSIFAPFVPFGRSLVGIYIASDWAKKTELYYITLKAIVEIFESVGKNYPSQVLVNYDKSKNEYIVESK